MNTDIYTKIIQTVIAICLIALLVQNQLAQRQQSTAAQVLDVNIVGTTKDLPVLIQGQEAEANSKTPLEIMIIGTKADLPVAVSDRKSTGTEDFCDISNLRDENITGAPMDEERVRKKCKVGDIIEVQYQADIGILCDLNRPVVNPMAPWAGLNLCFLAPPRKKY